MSSLSGIGFGGYNPYSLQQSLFNEINTDGGTSITKAEVEKAVTTAGGTTQAADALYTQLDPSNTGSVTEQQFSQNLPGLPYSAQIGVQMMSYQAQGWPGSQGTDPISQLAQNVFSQIDTSGSGSITKSELEQAVTSAGGTTQAADALYAQLDPNNTGSVSEQQFAQTLSQSMAHHHHHGASGSGNSANDALDSLFDANSTAATPGSSPTQIAQSIFSQIDTTGSGSITKSELEQAVTAAGGTTQSADALYSQLDPNNTGSVTEQQFTAALQPPSPTGDTAQDAILALLNPTTQSASSSSTSSTSGSSTTDTTSTPSITGNTAQDALLALMNNIGSSSSSTASSGNTAQDALLALMNALGPSSQDPLLSLTNTSSTSSSSVMSTSGTSAQDALFALLQTGLGGATGSTGSATGTQNGTDISAALALYQNQFNQQMLGSFFGTGGTAV